MTTSAKCIECKVLFDQNDDWNKRMCPDCTKEDKTRKSKESMAKQILKRSLASKSVVRECRFCSKKINGYYGKLYCSSTCSTKFWNITQDIVRTEEHIMRLHIKLEIWKVKLENIQ